MPENMNVSHILAAKGTGIETIPFAMAYSRADIMAVRLQKQ